MFRGSVVAIPPIHTATNSTMGMAQTTCYQNFPNVNRSVHPHHRTSPILLIPIVLSIIGILAICISSFILWGWASRRLKQRTTDNKCLEMQQQLDCIGLREHNWTDWAGDIPTLPPIDWSQLMHSTQTLVGGSHGNLVELDGGVKVILEGDSVRLVDQDREEDWETESENDAEDNHSMVISLRGPLCIADVHDRWGHELEEEELLGVEGHAMPIIEADKEWRTESVEDMLQVPAQAHLGFSSFV